MEVHDLLVAKVLAGRDKDLDFLRDAARHRLARADLLLRRLASVEADPRILEKARGAILRVFGEV